MQVTQSGDIVVFDAETTGIPLFKERSHDPRQPHLVELAALLYSCDGELKETLHYIVKPDGWEIPEETVAVHGITQARALAEGVPEADAIKAFMAMHARASLRVAHNRNFDDRLIRSGIARYMADLPTLADDYKDAPGECTALLSKPVCQIPPTEKMRATNFKNSFKTPTLAEALLCLTGNELVGAHTAEADAQACARIYFAIKGVRMPEFPTDIDKLEALPDEAQQCDAEPLLANETAAE